MSFSNVNIQYLKPEELAQRYLSNHFGDQAISYPISPFLFLNNEGVLFKLLNLKKLEGVYIPASSEDDLPVVGINFNRPITRQRFTAAHELCHHLKDSDKQFSCLSENFRNSKTEQFAEQFAAALLMPISELKKQVDLRKNCLGKINFDDVLEIADFFGVSFESCLYRIAYKLKAIDGDTSSSTLKHRSTEFHPDKKRKQKHMTYANLYADLIDNYREQLSFEPSNFSKNVFQNEYIYNDSRMEGLDVTIEQASEIVTDLRLNAQNSEYCTENNEFYLSIAGHYLMYQDIFSKKQEKPISAYDTIMLNRKLFSCYPYPDFGGTFRDSNTLVLGAKFETADYFDIPQKMQSVNTKIEELYQIVDSIPISEFIKNIAVIHHQLTLIHPFKDGNGRTCRAFINSMLVKAKLPPIYIKVETKTEYINALALADAEKNYDYLFELFFKQIIKSSIELSR